MGPAVQLVCEAWAHARRSSEGGAFSMDPGSATADLEASAVDPGPWRCSSGPLTPAWTPVPRCQLRCHRSCHALPAAVAATEVDPGVAAVDPGAAAAVDPGAAALEAGAAAAVDPGAAALEAGATAVDPGAAPAVDLGAAAVVDPGAAALDPIGASAMHPGASAKDPGAAAVDPGTSAVDPARGHDYFEPTGSQLHPGSQDGGACSLEGGPGYLSAEGGGSSSRSESVHVCAGCGAAPSAGTKLQACGRCLSVRYCSSECQAKHWREGGHKEACPWLRDIRARSKAAGG